MSDNTLVAVLVALIVGSCTTVSAIEKMSDTAQKACVRNAWTQHDRIQCLQQPEASK